MEDLSGPALVHFSLEQQWEVLATNIVDDEPTNIETALGEFINNEKVDLILTTGGTGIGPRDNTPEVTNKFLEKKLPGLGEMMRMRGSQITPTAILSRSNAGTVNGKIIVNLPGSPGGAVESLQAISNVLPHAIEMLRNLSNHQPK